MGGVCVPEVLAAATDDSERVAHQNARFPASAGSLRETQAKACSLLSIRQKGQVMARVHAYVRRDQEW
jgi:hypothetical protein